MVQTTINDKINGTDSASTSTSKNTYDWHCPYIPQTQQGWECPRCGRINAPWVRQCDCNRSNWSITWTSNHLDTDPEWWKHVTCSDTCPDNVLNNPVVYTTVGDTAVGGSDYYNPNTKTWDNVCKNNTNVKRG